MAIKVLLADDQAMLVRALSTILSSEPDIEVEATSACLNNQVDVAVLDIRMPVMDGIAAAQSILSRDLGIRIIMLTTFSDPDLVTAALKAGVHGFLLKDSDPEVLTAAVRAVHHGGSILSSKVTGPVLDAYRAALSSPRALTPEQRQGLALVTNREMDVLLLVAEGASNEEIAHALHLAPTTVKTHVSSLLAKLQARDRVSLALLAHHAGLSSSRRRR